MVLKRHGHGHQIKALCTEVVTSVFRQYETGLREGVIDAKVIIIRDNQTGIKDFC